MRCVGFYKELGFGHGDQSSLASARRDVAAPFEADLLNYLRSATGVAFCPSARYDWFDPAICITDGGWDILCDGVWYWPSTLAYYLDTYHVEVPADLVSRARKRSWLAPRFCDRKSARLFAAYRAFWGFPD